MSAITTSSGRTGCYAAKAPKAGPPLIQNGVVHLQAHHIGWIVSGVFAIIASVASFWLINKHVQWYTNKKEQRHVVRILLMVPIYAWISLASFLFWNNYTPLVIIRDCYEAIFLMAFFYLLLAYISPDPVEQKEVFMKLGLSREHDSRRQRKGEPSQKWVLPLGFIKSKPADGLHFLQFMKWGILQYCFIRPTTTLISVILNYVGLYCESSWAPSWGHVYLTPIVSLSVTIAMYCLIQVYVIISEPLKDHKPLLKIFAVKAVVFLTFWQNIFLFMLPMFGVVKDTQYMTAGNIIIGIGTIVECVEMTIFAFLHIKCFTYKVYFPDPTLFMGDISHQRTPRLRSLGHAMNFAETFREFWKECVCTVRHLRGEEMDIMQGGFGRSRKTAPSNKGKLVVAAVHVRVEEEVYNGEKRQWLGVEDEYGSHAAGGKRDGLLEQIEKELVARGHSGTKGHDPSNHDAEAGQGYVHGRRSWWRSMYDRVSRSGADEKYTSLPKRSSLMRSNNRRSAAMSLLQDEYDDPPSSSKLGKYKASTGSYFVKDVKMTNPTGRDPATPLSISLSDDDTDAQAESSSRPLVHSTSAPEAFPELSDSLLLLDRLFSHASRERYRPVSSEPGPSQGVHQSETRLVKEPKAPSMPVLLEAPEVDMPNSLVDSSGRRTTPRRAEERGSSKRAALVITEPQRLGARRLAPDARAPSFATQSRYTPSPSLTARGGLGRPGVNSTPPSSTRYRSAHRKRPPKFRPTKDQISLPMPLAPASEGHNLSLEASAGRAAVPYPYTSQQRSHPHGSRHTHSTPALHLVQPVLPPISSGSWPKRSKAMRRGSKDSFCGREPDSLDKP